MSNRLNTIYGRVALALATGLGIGMFSRMPGTLGSLWGPPLVWAMDAWIDSPAMFIAVWMGLFVLGVPICSRAAKQLNAEDPGAVVFDEIVAFPLMFLPMIVAGERPIYWGLYPFAFIWFRIFDVLKPWPVSRFDRLHGGLGIMADDQVAAVYAAAALWLTNLLLSAVGG